MLFRLSLGAAVVLLLWLQFGSAVYLGWLTLPREWIFNVLLVVTVALGLGAIRYGTDL